MEEIEIYRIHYKTLKEMLFDLYKNLCKQILPFILCFSTDVFLLRDSLIYQKYSINLLV